MCFFSSILHSWGGQTLTHHSPSPPWERSPASSSSQLCCLRGRGEKVSLTYSNASQLVLFLFLFFAATECWNLYCGEPGLRQRLSHPQMSAQVGVLQVLPDHSGEGLKPVNRFLTVPQPILMSVFQLPDAQVTKIPIRTRGI